MPKTGALPPDELAWQMGKTAASIMFEVNATKYLQSQKCTPSEKTILEDAIQQIKDGTLVFLDLTTPEEYLKQQKS